MTAVSIEPTDLAPFVTIDEATAQAMIADALAMAKLVAPCIVEDDFAHPDAAKAVIRGAILRWVASRSSEVKRQSAGSFSVEVDTSVPRKGMFWPDEIEQLQEMCKGVSDGAFAVDTFSSGLGVHGIGCSLVFGATYCSCGYDIAGYPIYGGE